MADTFTEQDYRTMAAYLETTNAPQAATAMLRQAADQMAAQGRLVERWHKHADELGKLEGNTIKNRDMMRLLLCARELAALLAPSSGPRETDSSGDFGNPGDGSSGPENPCYVGNAMRGEIEVRYDEPEHRNLDEVCANNAIVHLEQMNASQYSLMVYSPKETACFWITAKGGRIAAMESWREARLSPEPAPDVRLVDYVRHKPGCESDHWRGSRPCTCGLAALLAPEPTQKEQK